MRYCNAAEDLPEHVKEENPNRAWRNQKNVKQDAAPNVFLPAFTNPVAAMHLEQMKEKGNTTNRKAGFSDKILVHKATIGSSGNRFVIEGKTFWSFDDGKMANLVSASTAAPKTGVVELNVTSDEQNILTQVSNQDYMYILNLTVIKIWGECHFLDVDYGMITNGSTLRVFIKTGNNQLCFSDVKNWGDSDVFTAMLGLSFISIDHPKGDNEKIKKYLCDPVDDRQCDWLPKPKEEGEGEEGEEKLKKPKPSSPEVPDDLAKDPLYVYESPTTNDDSEEEKQPRKSRAKKTQVVAPDDNKKGKGPARRTAETKAKATVETKAKTVAEPAKVTAVAPAKAKTAVKAKMKTPAEAKAKTPMETKTKTSVGTRTRSTSKTTSASKSTTRAPSNKKPKAGPSTGRHRT